VRNAWSTNRGTTNQKLNKTLSSLHLWGSNRFSIIPKKIKTTQLKLQKLNEQNGNTNADEKIRNTEKELDELLECEELWWSQRSRVLWLQNGDKTPNIFI
jgi:hypothetical protein